MLLVPSLLAVAFVWAAIAKVTRFPAWRSALSGYSLPATAVAPALVIVPLLELATAFLLARGGDATKAGAALSVALLGAFSLAVLRARRLQGDRLPCGCFGGSGSRDYRLILVRNAALGTVAAAILLVRDVARYEIDAPAASQVVPAALAATGLALIAWLVVAFGHGARR
ncbi:MAG TPA: MauE/DoxX family redox-associated membrane protein [Actinomycetota bacterium]|nr:MauE/DoxX family redox-associated membrane protein [Actinomycetota bacterium]